MRSGKQCKVEQHYDGDQSHKIQNKLKADEQIKLCPCT